MNAPAHTGTHTDVDADTAGSTGFIRFLGPEQIKPYVPPSKVITSVRIKH